MTNEMTTLIQQHRSIRKFTAEPISNQVVDDIVTSGQWAPSSHHVQAYSIVVVKNQESKNKLAELTGNQSYVAECPVFFVICADFYRLKQASDKHGMPFEINEVENVLVGAVDAALVAQNMLLAARSYGLGGVMIGGIRNNPDQVAEQLELPELVIPIMGLCVGYPDQQPEQKPRFSKNAVVHEERYSFNEADLERYDEITKAYYTKRTNGKRTDSWSEMMAKHFSTRKRPHVTTFIKKQGIDLT